MGKGLVNLMGSLGRNFGYDNSYKDLDSLPNLDKSSVILIILDGMGYDLVMNYSKGFLKEKTIDKMYTVFPTTTVAAVTSLMSGEAPLQHGITGWWMCMSEFSTPKEIIRINEESLPKNVKANQIFPKSFFSKINIDSYMVIDSNLIDTLYNKCNSEKSIPLTYKPGNLDDFINKINGAIKKPNPKYACAYWPGIDHLSHEKGKHHPDTLNHFYKLSNV